MKVKLNILERHLIMNMLPAKGDLVTCRASSNTTKLLTPTEEEKVRYEIKNNNGVTSWNPLGVEEEKEFELPPSSVKVIMDTLYEFDSQKNLPITAITLCEKFLPEEGKKPQTPA